MNARDSASSRVHDLIGTILGLFAALMLATIRWQVDTSGPDPFYKGSLIFPLLVLCLMLLASLPAMWRLLHPPAGASWHLDGEGLPGKSAVVLGLMIAFIAGLVYLGLVISCWLFMLVGLWAVGQRELWKLLFLPTVVTAVLYFIFMRMLDVYFPTPVLLDMLME